MLLITTDKVSRKVLARERQAFSKARNAEASFARQLRTVAKTIGDIVDAFPVADPASVPPIRRSLEKYSELLKPWAQAAAQRMSLEVARRDEKAWQKVAATMSRNLRQELRSAPIGNVLREYMAEQVHLITSLPLDAAQRVHKLTIEAQEDSSRFNEIAKEIRRTSAVSRSRANLIARTEVARTASAITMTRAEHVGSEGYIWRTAEDSDVRESHRRMNGKYVEWDKPPTLSDGTTTHAGMIYNCRCYPEPVIPDTIN